MGAILLRALLCPLLVVRLALHVDGLEVHRRQTVPTDHAKDMSKMYMPRRKMPYGRGLAGHRVMRAGIAPAQTE